jgi:tetratricopeptide (TPR) repeat protein
MNVDDVRPMIKRLSENRIFDPQLKWFKHDLVKKCFEDDLDPEELKSYHNRAARFFESLTHQQEQERRTVQTEKSNDNDEDNTDMAIELKEKDDSYFLTISTAYHLHMAGGKNHEKSFTRNKMLGHYAFGMGNLDVAERSYKRAIEDADKLGRVHDKMVCTLEMVNDVYLAWFRDANGIYKIYEDLIEYISKSNDRKNYATALFGLGVAYSLQEKSDMAMEKYTQSLEISKLLGDKYTVARVLHKIANILFERAEKGTGEYAEALEKYQESLSISHDIRNAYTEGLALLQIGNTYTNEGNFEIAMEKFQESMLIMKQAGDQYQIANILLSIGLSFIAKEEISKEKIRSQLTKALPYILNAYRIFEVLGRGSDAEIAKENISYIRKLIGDEEYTKLSDMNSTAMI